MKLAFVVNDVATEQDNYTTIRLGAEGCGAGGTRSPFIGSWWDFISRPFGQHLRDGIGPPRRASIRTMRPI